MNDDKNLPILEAKMTNLQVTTLVKPKTTAIVISIQNLVVFDHFTKSEPSPFFAIDYEHPLSKAKDQMLYLTLDVNPPDEGVDLRLGVKTQPVLITFSKVMIDRIVEFYSPPSDNKNNQNLMDQLAMVSDLGLDKISKQVFSFFID
jgi:hypothetical protein